jgi:hypothetical protein
LKRAELAEHRVFVTSGQRQRGDQVKWAANREYIDSQIAAGVHIAFLFKPHSGIFRLWEDSALIRRLSWLGKNHRYRGVGDGYDWPPRRISPVAKEHTHSAPGVLQAISQTLIDRAQQIRGQVRCVSDAVRGAVFATDALELLAGRTPTTSIDALSLKHEFEVIAECQFSGAEYHLGLAPRFREIARDVEVISRSFHPSHRETAALNAEMKIVSKILLIFRENAQYDEEQACMNRVRHLQNTLWMQREPIRHLLWPVVRYIEALLASFPRFLFVILCWIMALGALYTYFGGHEYWYWGIEDAITSFFSIGGPIHEGPDILRTFGYVGVTCVGIVAGFVHLGIFVSHLYSLVSRK